MVRFAVVVLAAGCGTDPVDEAGGNGPDEVVPPAEECGDTVASVRYDDIDDALANTCGACHYTEPAGVAFVEGEYSYDLLVGVPSTEAPDLFRVDPGHPETSYLWHKLQGTHLDVGGEGDPMPPDNEDWQEYLALGSVPLSAATVQGVHDWICGGALP